MLPKDIDPESRCRLPMAKREDMDPEGQAVYDQVVTPTGINIRGLKGPGGIGLHSPRLAKVSRPVNRYLRAEAGLPPKVREVAILATARQCDSQFEWAAHEPEALKEGVPMSVIDIIKHRKSTAGLAEPDAFLIDLAREGFGAHKVASETFARGLKLFGARQLLDIVVLMGNYAATAMLLATFDMQLDEGQPPLLPVP